MTRTFLGVLDRAALLAMVERHTPGLAAVLEALSWICLEKERVLLPGPQKERWALGHRIAADAAARALELGL